MATVIIEKVDLDHMIKVARAAKVEFKDESPANLVAALEKHYAKMPASKLSGCDECHGTSATILGSCAFCGTLDDEDEDERESTPRVEDPPGKGKLVRRVAANDASTAPKVHSGTVEGTPKPPLKKGIVVATDVTPAAPEKANVALPPLDNAVAHIAKIKGQQAATCWDLGKFVHDEVYQNKLWLQRVDPKTGKPAYKSFAAWVRSETGLSDSYVYGCIEVSQSLSRDDASKLGSKHLHVLMGAPKEDRQALLLKAKEEHLTVRQTKALVDDTRKKKGVKVQNNRGREMPQGGRVAERIALTLATSRINIPLLKKGTDRPAKRLGDTPTIRIEGQNGVVLVLTIQENSKGELYASGTPKREE